MMEDAPSLRPTRKSDPSFVNESHTDQQQATASQLPWAQSAQQAPLPAPPQAQAEPAPAQAAEANPSSEEADRQIQAGLEAWAQQMEIYTGPDAMLDFNPVDYVHIDFTDANSSGVAQLFMGRKTRLSTILRDKSKLEAGMVAARALRTKIYELASGHGLDAGYFVAGTASWLSHDVKEKGMVGEKRFIAPILMAPLAISPHPSSEDFEIQLTGPAMLNPAMVRQIKKEYGVDLGQMDVAQLANSMRKLDPEPVIERMRASTGAIPGMTIRSTYFISTLADLKESTGQLTATSQTQLVQDVAQLMLNPLAQPAIKPLTNSRIPLDFRDPEEDLLILDADQQAQEVLDYAQLGRSMTVLTPPGSDQLGTALNLASTLINQGKSVLVVGEKRSTLSAFQQLLEAKQVDNLTYNLLAEKDAESQRQDFIAAIVRNEQAPAPNLRSIRDEIIETRSKLRNHTDSLRFTESRWGCSVYEALQTLAALTAQEPAPSTSVRLTRPSMDVLVDRQETRTKLERLAALGAFRPSTRASAWYRAKLVNQEETKAAHQLALDINHSLETVSRLMATLAQESGLGPASSLADWGQQLDLLIRIRQSLTSFKAQIFERPVTDLIAATASGAWRREKGVEMSSIQRSRLRKAAKEYILPGVSIADLHQTLFVIQGQREEWLGWASSQTVPSIPANLDEVTSAYQELTSQLTGLAIVLEDSPAGTNFLEAPLTQLRKRILALVEDEALLHSLPERVDLTQQMLDLGLGDLLDDFYERQLPADQLAAELELAWWQTALEMMLSSQELDILDAQALRDLEARFRRADYSYLAAGPARLQARVADLWKETISREESAAAYLRSQLRSHQFNLQELLTHAPSMASTLLPLWISSPFSLTRTVPASMRFDAAILLDAESTPLAANLPALMRAQQVIALGDPNSGSPAPFMVSALARNTPLPRQQKIVSTFEGLSRVLPSTQLTLVTRALDPALFGYLKEHFYGGQLETYPWAREYQPGNQALTVEYVDVTGRVSDNASLDSPSLEVERVAQMVIEHAYRQPDLTLAVVTTSTRHAQRIAEAVRQLINRYPQFAPFFAAGQEAFRVVDLSRAGDLERDVIIFALGAGKTAQGASHHFGLLSEKQGRQKFVLATTRARQQTRLVTCLQPEDLDPQRLEEGAFDIYRLLLAYRKEQEARAQAAQVKPLTEQVPANDFLHRAELDALDMGDWLLNDLIRRLHPYPLTMEESSNPLLSLILTRKGEEGSQVRPLALISDGSDAYAALTVRMRSRLVPELLTRTGWNQLTCWTIEVFSDPLALVERSRTELGLGDRD